MHRHLAGGVAIAAAFVVSLAAAAQTPSSAAAPPPLVLTGSVGGPGFSSAVPTWVWADIDTDLDHPGAGVPRHRALTRTASVSPSGAFVLPVPSFPALSQTVAEIHSDAGVGGPGSQSWPELATFRYWNKAASQVDIGESADGNLWAFHGMVTFNTEKGTSNTWYTDPQADSWAYTARPTVKYKRMRDRVICPQVGSQDGDFHVTPDSCCDGESWGGPSLSGLDSLQEYQHHRVLDPTHERVWGNQPNSAATKTRGMTERFEGAASAFGFSLGVTSQYGNGMELLYDFDDGATGAGGYSVMGPHYVGPITWKIYWLWGQAYEDSFQDASTIDAFTWADAFTDPGTGTTSAIPPGPFCYGTVCPI